MCRALFFLLIIQIFTVSNLISSEKTVVITCATGALGESMARLLAKDHNLILTGRDYHRLQALKKDLERTTRNEISAFQLDYCDYQSVALFVDFMKDRKISGFVLLTPRPQLDLFADEPEWLKMLQSCFTGPQEVLKGYINSLKEKAKIVVIAGTTSVQVMPDYGPAAILRRMWVAYTKVLSHKLGPKLIHVNTLSPGVVLTDFHKSRIQSKADQLGRTYEEQLALEVDDTPLKRFALPEEVASSVRFLLSDESDHITGINLVIDRGITKVY